MLALLRLETCFMSPTRTRRLIVGLIFCLGVLTFIDRVNISIAAQYIMPEYRLTDVQMGTIFSSFVLGYALLQIPGGWLGDCFGPRRVLAISVFWWSVFTAGTVIVGDFFSPIYSASLGPLWWCAR